MRGGARLCGKTRLLLPLQISQFDNSDYDALLNGVTGDIMHKPNGDIHRDPVIFDTISNYRTGFNIGVDFSSSKVNNHYTHFITDGSGYIYSATPHIV